MSGTIAAGVAGLIAAWSGSAAVGVIDAEVAIRKYCEPLVTGSSARQVADLARQDGLRDEVVMGQPVLRVGELLVGISDNPRVCFVQAPAAMTFDQGVALVDAWAKRDARAVQSPAKRGPDGAPVRGWTAPTRKMAIVASQQSGGPGRKVMNFILMPLPAKPSTK